MRTGHQGDLDDYWPMPGLESMSNRVSRTLAGRVTRRSFLSRLGRGAIAVSLGSAAGATFLAGVAGGHTPDPPADCGDCGPHALECCTSGRDSISCQELNGHNQNICPGSSESCGSWCITVSTSTCSSGFRKWTDCCGNAYCDGGQNCHCENDPGGTSRQSCCRHKFYTGGQMTSSNQHIACRKHACVSSLCDSNAC
jgi:hypothetical protein